MVIESKSKYFTAFVIAVLILFLMVAFFTRPNRSIENESPTATGNSQTQQNASSDFSQFPTYPNANLIDSSTEEEQENILFNASWRVGEDTVENVTQWYQKELEDLDEFQILPSSSESDQKNKIVVFSDPTTYVLTVQADGQNVIIQLEADYDMD